MFQRTFHQCIWLLPGLVTVLVHLLGVVSGQDVIGCGGFVRSNKNIDASRIQMVLMSSKNGNIRKVGSTDCAPINGYYFIPVYENGDYILKANAPRGWKVEPSEIPLKIDGKSDDCSKNVDLNFEFIGFGITGSVLSQGSTTGPAGIGIELLSPDGKNVLQTAATNEEGHFDFFGVSPGSYFIRIANQFTKSYAFDANQRQVKVGEDVGVCQPFKIEGYELSGEVKTKSGRPLADVELKIVPEEGSGSKTSNVRTDSNGKFSVRLPNGKYVLKPDVGKLEVKLVQAEKEAVIAHKNLNLEAFEVDTFTLRGKVMTAENGGKPVANAKVVVTHDGKSVDLSTGSDGSFLVKEVAQGPVTAKVTYEGYDFEISTLATVNPGDKFNTIVPSRYRLTGKVDRDSLPVDTEVRVKFTTSDDAKSHNGQVTATDKGTYSVYLPAGRYSVSVVLSVEQANIGFAPLKHEVSITDSPVNNINFQPIKANLDGRVTFLGSKSSQIEISLVAESGNFPQQRVATDSKGNFKFASILPGMYKLSVHDSENLCWDETVKQLSVSEDIKNIQFKQTGFKVSAHSVRSAVLVLNDGSSVDEVQIVRGDNQICIKSQKPVKISTKGCVEYEIEPDRIEDPSTVASDFRIILKPIKFLVSGSIASKKPINDLKLTVTSELRKVEVPTVKTDIGYAFNFMAMLGEDLAFHPTSEEHLFDPDTLTVLVDNDCHLDSVKFEGSTGFFLRGKIDPPVDNVKIKVIDSSSNALKSTIFTDAKGSYKVGPLPADSTYEITAEKEGYIFEQVVGKQGQFSAKKLASIVVKVSDVANGALLSGVVVSLSGGSDYRSNTMTKVGGEATFLSLAPGRYFAKPQIKEYEFEPKHQILDLAEGQTGELSFTGKRVAFSIFGKITSINGEPESGVTLKAKGVSPQVCVGHSEEATSEHAGDFRFRGLQPNCEYVIALQSEKREIEKLIPSETRVVVGENDTDLPSPIIAMRPFEFTDTTIIIADEVQVGKPSLVKVTVSSESGFSYTTHALVGQLVTLPRISKNDQKYTVNVETPSGAAIPKKASTFFRADEYFKRVEVTLTRSTPTVSKTVRKISAFVYLLPLVIVALLSYIFWDKMPVGVQNTIEKIFTLGSGSSTQSASQASDDVWDGSAAAKKRAKKRA